jgi:hypothetical protein
MKSEQFDSPIRKLSLAFFETTRGMSTAVGRELSRLTAKWCREQHSTDLNGPFLSRAFSRGKTKS